MRIKIKRENVMGYAHIDPEEIEMIKDHLIEGKGSLTIDSITLNCTINDEKKSYPAHGLLYPLKESITITKE